MSTNSSINSHITNLPAESNRAARLQSLVTAVCQVQPAPLDAWEIAAILESLGYTDQLAQTQWDTADIRELSQQVY
jgi:hypothetical protein